MLIDPSSANAFIAGYKRLLLHVAEDLGMRGRGRPVLETLVRARNQLTQDPALLERAIHDVQASECPVDDDVLRAIRTLCVEQWVYLRDTRTYSIFVHPSGEQALGVVGLTQRIREIVGGSGFFLEAGVVRYSGRPVCDGLVGRVAHLGPGYRREFEAAYRALRVQGRFEAKDASRIVRRTPMATPRTRLKSKASAAKPKLLSGGNPQIPKGDGDAPVQAYIAAMPGWKREIGQRLDALIARTVPGVRKAVRWNSPFYGVEGRGWFLGVHCLAKYVKIAFYNGASLRPPPPVESKLAGVRYLHLHEDDFFDEKQFAAWIRQAAKLPGTECF